MTITAEQAAKLLDLIEMVENLPAPVEPRTDA